MGALSQAAGGPGKLVLRPHQMLDFVGYIKTIKPIKTYKHKKHIKYYICGWLIYIYMLNIKYEF